MFYACSGHTLMIMGLVIAPAVMAQVVLFWSKGLKHISLQVCAIFSGALAATAFLGLVHWFVGGRFLFFMPQLMQAVWTLSHRNYSRWEQPVSAWLPIAYRLLLPAAAVALAVLRPLFSRGLKSAATPIMPAMTVFVVWSVALFAYFGFVKNALVLQVSYASVFLLVPSLLFLGFLFGECWEGLSARDGYWLTVVTTTAVALLFTCYWYLQKSRVVVPLAILSSVSTLVLLPAIRRPELYRRTVLALLLLMGSIFPLLADSSINGPAFQASTGAFEAALHVRQLITFVPAEHKLVRFWFGKDEKDHALFDSVASLYTWGSPSETETLVRTSQEHHEYAFAKNTLFVILSSKPDQILKDEELLSGYGLKPDRQALVRVVRGPYDFYVGVVATP
jgi:hypothetical protein